MVAVACGPTPAPAPPTEAPATPTEAPTEAPPPPPEKLKVAFVYVAPIGDLGWTWAHEQGRLMLEEEFGDKVETAYIENVPEGPDAERVIRDFAQKGYDLIFATSFGFMDPMVTVASEFPDKYFEHCSGYKTADNMATYFGRMYQPRYLSGLVAGKATEANKIGYVAAFPIPEVVRGINAFALGVREANPEATVHVVWTNTWFDPVLEKEAADALLDEGCDVIAQHQDTTEPQKAAQERGMVSIGYDSDMSQFVGDTVLTSPIWNWGPYYTERTKAVMNGTWETHQYWGGMEDGIVDLAPLSDKVPDEVRALVEEKKGTILSGEWDVFTGPIKGQNGELSVPEGVSMTDEEMLSMDWFVEGVVGEAPGEPPAAEAAPGEKFRVAVVMPSAINDLAFSQSMYDALVAIQEEMGADNFEFAYSDGLFVVDDAAAAVRDYATQGYDLVIAHGSQYGSSLVEIAPDFPDTSFAWGTTVDTFTDQGINNVFAYEARSEEGGYVLGVIAVSLSESGVLGVIGPIETGDAKLYVDGFKAGVLATKSDATVNVNWTGSFSDVALASEAAQTHINAGADALTGSAQMVVGAVGVAEENDVLWFGTQADQTSLAPDIVVACQVYDWTVALGQIIELIQGGTLGGQAFALDLANDGLKIQYNPDYAVPDEVKTLADETIQGIIDGSIAVLE
jgi:basic membrane protein A